MLKRVALVTLTAVALLAIAVWLLLPPAARPAAPGDVASAWVSARGAFHVHSNRSDGTGSLDDIAAAAARAGLQFVVVTDHGDGTRPPVAPHYRTGVLCLDGVEISTDDGHYATVGLPQTPYPLAGRARAVIDDVRFFGGIGFAAHPGSPKAELQWTAWDAPFDGLEWLNADSEWRDEFWGSLGRVLLTYTFRPVETLGALLDRPTPVLSRWDELTRQRRVPAIAGADAHARLGFRQGREPYEERVVARAPSYEVSFRAFTNHVVLDRPLTGDPAIDAALVLAALREGRIVSSIDSLAGVGGAEFRATSGGHVARPGEYLDFDGAAVIEAQVAAPAGTTLVVIRNGEPIYERAEPAVRLDVGSQPGAYRLEARLPGQRADAVPWILTNPIYVGLRDAHAAETAAPSPDSAEGQRLPIATERWTAEASPGSSSALEPSTLDDGTPVLAWTFALAPGAPAGQYAAVRFPLDAALTAGDRVQLRLRSDRPRRLWLQLRAPGAGEGERWGASLRVDDRLTTIDIPIADFHAIGATSSPRPVLDRIDSLLLVVDTVNSRPGSAGGLAVAELWRIAG